MRTLNKLRKLSLGLGVIVSSFLVQQCYAEEAFISNQADNWQFISFPNNDIAGILMSETGSNKTEIHRLDNKNNYKSFNLQAGTGLHITNIPGIGNWKFLTKKNGDLVAIKMNATGTNKTEVHTLSASSGYKNFSLQVGTALHSTTPEQFDFAIMPNDDIAVIKMNGTGTKSTELHILDSKSNYAKFKTQIGTALHETSPNTFDFHIKSNGDLVAIKMNQTGSNSTEIHILDAKSNYKKFNLQTGTALHETSPIDYDFTMLGDDIGVIKKRNTGSKKTEIHVLSSSSNYKNFKLQTGTSLNQIPYADIGFIKKTKTGTGSTEVHLLGGNSLFKKFKYQTGTKLGSTDSKWKFLRKYNGDIVGIKMSQTGTKKTEVHVLSAATGYKKFNLQTGTALHETLPSQFDFAMLPNGDIAAIKMNGTGTKTTELHILEFQSNYKKFKIQTGTALHETSPNTFDFHIKPNGDLVAIKMNNTDSKSTEVHILDAKSNYKKFSMQTGTALHETNPVDFSFLLHGDDIIAIKKRNTGTKLTEAHILTAVSGYKKFSVQTGTALDEFKTTSPVNEGLIGSPVFDVNFYKATYPDLKNAYGDDNAKYASHFINNGLKEGRIGSPVFDVNFYKATYPDLKNAYGDDNAKYASHFINNGLKEGRIGSLLFDVNFYKATYSDLKNAYGDDNAKYASHFINNGLKEGRIGSPVFDVNFYKATYSDLKNAYGDDNAKYASHFINNGLKEGRMGSLLLDVNFYKATYPDLKNAYGADNAKYASHFINNGLKEGRIGSLLLDVNFYKATYPDLKNAYGADNAKYASHFINNGLKEGRIGSLLFDVNFYKATYSDLKNAYGDDNAKYASHFINNGLKEGRMGSLFFDVNFYKSAYADLKNAYGDDNAKYASHFINNGLKEGRTSSIIFDVSFYKGTYADLRKAFTDDNLKYIIHFVTQGPKEERRSSPVFDLQFYKSKYLDLQKSYGNNNVEYISHFIRNGIKEGRVSSLAFDINYYKNTYADLKNTFGDDNLKYITHFLTNGMKEGRASSPLFNLTKYDSAYPKLSEQGYTNKFMIVGHWYEYCRNGTCKQQGLGGACKVNTDCSKPNEMVCADGICKSTLNNQCEKNEHCVSQKCNTDNNTCVKNLNFIVNSTADTGNESCPSNKSSLTLRQAINCANELQGKDYISFDLPDSAVIRLSSKLPDITQPVVINTGIRSSVLQEYNKNKSPQNLVKFAQLDRQINNSPGVVNSKGTAIKTAPEIDTTKSNIDTNKINSKEYVDKRTGVLYVGSGITNKTYFPVTLLNGLGGNIDTLVISAPGSEVRGLKIIAVNNTPGGILLNSDSKIINNYLLNTYIYASGEGNEIRNNLIEGGDNASIYFGENSAAAFNTSSKLITKVGNDQSKRTLILLNKSKKVEINSSQNSNVIMMGNIIIGEVVDISGTNPKLTIKNNLFFNELGLAHTSGSDFIIQKDNMIVKSCSSNTSCVNDLNGKACLESTYIGNTKVCGCNIKAQCSRAYECTKNKCEKIQKRRGSRKGRGKD